MVSEQYIDSIMHGATIQVIFPFVQFSATRKAERALVIILECGQSINRRKENI